MKHVCLFVGLCLLPALAGGCIVEVMETPLRADGPPTLLFAASEAGGGWDIWIQDIESGTRSNLTGTPPRGLADFDDRNPSLSYDGRLIAYTSTADHESDGVQAEEIFSMARDGTGQRRLTDDDKADGPPEWAGFGNIVFTSCRFRQVREPDCQLDEIAPDGTGRATTLDDLGLAFSVTRSPNGSQIAYSRYVGTRPGIYIRTIGRTQVRRLADGSGAQWSPDGKRIVFSSDRDKNGRCLFRECSGNATELYVVDTDGTDQRRLTHTTATESFASWTPDGNWVLVSRIGDESDDYDVFAIRADGDCEVQLTDTKAWEWSASWIGSTDSLDC